MLIALVRKYETQGLRTVVISSNDAAQYPEDSFEAMTEKALRMELPYPYLYDENQQVARKFDAECTPELYLFDGAGRLAYHGAMSDSPRDATKVTKDYLSSALAAVLSGAAPEVGFVHPIGCSIKWKREMV
jgi:AhpC/TSA family